MAYLNKMDQCTSNWIADYKKIRLLSSIEQLRKLKTFRKGELTEGVGMEYAKPQATCGQGVKDAKWRMGLYLFAQDQNCRFIRQAWQIQE